jgi:hypothetical protein
MTKKTEAIDKLKKMDADGFGFRPNEAGQAVLKTVKVANEALLDRAAKCLSGSRCFISLKFIEEGAGVEINHPVAGVVKVLAKYAPQA